MKIGPLDTREKVIIIAEIGNNHEGDIGLAEAMIRAASRSKADIVKFQAIEPARLVSHKDHKRLAQLEKFRFSPKQFEHLCQVAQAENIQFLCTPFSLPAVHFLNPFVPAFKIASGDNNFLPLIKEVALTGKPLIISGGLSSLDQLREVRNQIRKIWDEKGILQEMAFLHCIVKYPTPPEQAHLKALRLLSELGTTVGYSDHTIGIDAAVLSVGLGARIIEKHFTLNKQQSEFRDHQLSADPVEMTELVKRIRDAERFLGSTSNDIVTSDADMIKNVRRSIVASRPLTEGAIIGWDDLNWVRPGEGLAPGREGEVVGKKLKRGIAEGEYILLQDLESQSEAC